MFERIKSLGALPQQWVDKVAEGDAAATKDIRKRRGNRAANRHQARSERFRDRMQKRVDPELTRKYDEKKDG